MLLVETICVFYIVKNVRYIKIFLCLLIFLLCIYSFNPSPIWDCSDVQCDIRKFLYFPDFYLFIFLFFLILFIFFKFFFQRLFIFETERDRALTGEHEHEQEQGRERGRHRIRNRLQAPSCQHRARCGARIHGP